MQRQREHAGQRAEADRSHENDAHDDFRNRAQCAQHDTADLINQSVRRDVGRGQKRERQRDHDGERGAGDRHGERIDQRLDPVCQREKSGGTISGRKLGERRNALDQTLGIEESRDPKRRHADENDPAARPTCRNAARRSSARIAA